MALTLLATIPFPVKTIREAAELDGMLKSAGIIVDTRSDWTQIVERSPEHFDDCWGYLVIHTGNLLGMVEDLKESNFL